MKSIKDGNKPFVCDKKKLVAPVLSIKKDFHIRMETKKSQL